MPAKGQARWPRMGAPTVRSSTMPRPTRSPTPRHSMPMVQIRPCNPMRPTALRESCGPTARCTKASTTGAPNVPPFPFPPTRTIPPQARSACSSSGCGPPNSLRAVRCGSCKAVRVGQRPTISLPGWIPTAQLHPDLDMYAADHRGDRRLRALVVPRSGEGRPRHQRPGRRLHRGREAEGGRQAAVLQHHRIGARPRPARGPHAHRWPGALHLWRLLRRLSCAAVSSGLSQPGQRGHGGWDRAPRILIRGFRHSNERRGPRHVQPVPR